MDAPLWLNTEHSLNRPVLAVGLRRKNRVDHMAGTICRKLVKRRLIIVWILITTGVAEFCHHGMVC